MISFLLRLAGATLSALALGLGFIWLSVASAGSAFTIENGPWQTDTRIGSAASSWTLRAQIALGGLFALKQSETLYYSASRDSAGETLDGSCVYRIEGVDPDARWWSITSYAHDNFLIPNPRGIYSISKTSVGRNADGGFLARVSHQPLDGNWIPADKNGFVLMIRLYQPTEAFRAALATAPLPRITKESCQ
ncbi:MAG TPA: hypothetical protein DCL54_01630 [Alphaproteobacteria bacterium]|nr:hypothetical protein [Alphaproteobacteria bacterium]